MQEIINSMASFGLLADGLITDGRIHRCHSEMKKKRNRDGWYAVNEYHGHYYCTCGCWIRGETKKISTKTGMNGNDDAWRIINELHRQERKRKEKEGRDRVQKYIKGRTRPADPDHPYLKKKHIQPHGIFQDKEILVLPVLDDTGQISGAQTIRPDGKKKNMYGGPVGGCCFPIDGDQSVICVCEGFATGASINEATGYKALVSLSAGNIEKVAAKAQQKFPHSRIIICADNDTKTKGNPGLTIAKKASERLNIECVWPTNISGSDFNDMVVEHGIDSVRQVIAASPTIEVMTAEDFIGCDDTIIIPDEAIPTGLISEGIEALSGDIIQYDLPLVLTVIARSIAGKINVNSVHPNVFNIKVGGTSTGKSASDKKFLQCLDIEKFVAMNDIASGPGMLRGIADNPQGMGFFDEVTSLFRRVTRGGVDVNAEGKSDALLDIFSRSGQSFRKTYGDSKNSIVINNPCFSLLGNATPVIFDAIQLKDFETGLMQRFDFWMYDGPILPKKLCDNQYYTKTRDFISKLNDRIQIKPPQINIATIINQCIPLETTDKAMIHIMEYSDYVVETANQEESAGLVGIVSRKFDLALKYALIHHTAARKPERMFAAIDEKDIRYGILIAEMLGGWKINVASGKVVSGDFHRDCEVFRDAIKQVVKMGKKDPTFKLMANRKPLMKNWEPKHSQTVIDVLKKRGEIVTKELNGITRYYLPRECKND